MELKKREQEHIGTLKGEKTLSYRENYNYLFSGIKMGVIGKSVIRKDALDKVTGIAQYTGDYQTNKMLSAK